MKPFKMDFHTHSDFSPDSNTPMEEMILEAIRQNITDLCFTEHVDYDSDPSGTISSWDFNRPKYFEHLEKMKEKFKKDLRLYAGVEIGMQPQVAKENFKVARSWPFDFVLASLHTVDGYDLFQSHYFDKQPALEAVRRYYEAYYENILHFNDYDVLGHLDLYLRYSPQTHGVVLKDFIDYLDELLKKVIASGKGIEINAGGFRYGLENNNPHFDIVKRYGELGGEIITLGSDAHRPNSIGCAYEQNIHWLKSNQFKYITTFKERKPVFHKL